MLALPSSDISNLDKGITTFYLILNVVPQAANLILFDMGIFSSSLESPAAYLEFLLTLSLPCSLRHIFALAITIFCLLVLKDDIGAKTN